MKVIREVPENENEQAEPAFGYGPTKCPYCQSDDISAGAGHWECRDCGREGSY